MNVVHRDVTPRNVMVDYEGQVKVIDFGISSPVATAPTGEGVFGSPGHMPPEQMEGKELTPAADVFAVAVLLMELWSGKAPFRKRTREDIEAAMRGAAPEAERRRHPPLAARRRDGERDGARPEGAAAAGRRPGARAAEVPAAGVDLHDVARQLGDRVKNVRENPPPPVERAEGHPPAPAVAADGDAGGDEDVRGAQRGRHVGRRFRGSSRGPGDDARRP